MIDINKARNNYQQFPTTKQKCDTVAKEQTNNATAAATNQAAETAAEKGATTATITNDKEISAKVIHLKDNHIQIITKGANHVRTTTSASSSTSVTATTTTTTTASLTNAVRAANQQFFLISAFKDQNFLKEECQLAQAQVTNTSPEHQQHLRGAQRTTNEARKSVLAATWGEDKRNNNNSKDILNNNNNNSSNNNNVNKTIIQLPRTGAGTGGAGVTASLTNGMRRSGNVSYLGTSTATATTKTTTTTAGSTAGTTSSGGSVHKVDIVFNQFTSKVLSNTPKSITSSVPSTSLVANSKFTTPTTAAATNNSRSVVKPLIHRTIPTTALAAVNSYNNNNSVNINNNSHTQPNNNNNNSNSSSSNNSSSGSLVGNNNMQHICSRGDSLDHDDIKYIDSDETPAERSKTTQCDQRCCMPNAGGGIGVTPVSALSANSKSRIRPRSTIISSLNQNVFEKVNSYKYANGSIGNTASALATAMSNAQITTTSTTLSNSAANSSHLSSAQSSSSRRNELRHSGIDSSSIKASIEKFNSFSEQKRLPLSSVTLRSHSGSGSTSNLQHHRHSSDFDNCNLRLPASSGGSLTRSPYRTTSASKVITSLHPTVSAISAASAARSVNVSLSSSNSSSGSNSTNSLPTKGSVAIASRNNEILSSRSSLERERVVNNKMSLQQELHALTTTTAATTNNASTSLAMESRKPYATAPLNNTSITENASGGAAAGSCGVADDSVRSSAIRSVLPPPSPTTSRYYDRDSSRTSSTLSSLSSSSHNNTDDIKKSSDEKSEGLCGLRNIGNTCFMNSVIQCLSHTSELTKFLRTHNGMRTSSSSKDQQILYEFAKLIREMWTSNAQIVTPMELKRAFSTKHRMYSDYNQQDAQEFLRFFLDSLHSALNTGVKGEHLKIDDNLSDNKKADLTWEWYTRHENSLIQNLFVGQLKSTLKCTTCGNTSVTFDPFWDLSVSLPSSSRCKLEACLDLFIREEILDGDEMPTCSKCQVRRKCTKSFTIQRFPKYLVIHLKRFSETRWSKLSNIVEFPTGERELNMGAYGSNPNTNIYYSLYAISNHMGSTAGGHYVALCKHPISKKWHEFNDNTVSDALSEHHLVSSSAYILFYERA